MSLLCFFKKMLRTYGISLPEKGSIQMAKKEIMVRVSRGLHLCLK
jgi:hypothetical protein